MKTQLTITIGVDILEKLFKLRKEQNIKISSLINRLVKEYLETLK